MPDLLPNCLTKKLKVDWNLSRNGTTWFYLFCASCGADGGRVMETDIPNRAEFGFYLCDSCAEKHGHVAGLMMVPDELFWGKVADAQMEKCGALLTPLELAIQLQDESSFMSKLKKEKY